MYQAEVRGKVERAQRVEVQAKIIGCSPRGTGVGWGTVHPEDRMRRVPPPGPKGVLEVDWPFFGELCRALALRVAREYEPEIVLGIAKAGVIPGVVVASIMQCEFSS